MDAAVKDDEYDPSKQMFFDAVKAPKNLSRQFIALENHYLPDRVLGTEQIFDTLPEALDACLLCGGSGVTSMCGGGWQVRHGYNYKASPIIEGFRETSYIYNQGLVRHMSFCPRAASITPPMRFAMRKNMLTEQEEARIAKLLSKDFVKK